MAVEAERMSPMCGAGPGGPAFAASAISKEPAMAVAMPTRNTARGRSRNANQLTSVTITGVRFGSTVALATEV